MILDNFCAKFEYGGLMSAVGCCKNANFGVDSNPCSLRTPKIQKNSKKFAGYEARTAQNWSEGEQHAMTLHWFHS